MPPKRVMAMITGSLLCLVTQNPASKPNVGQLLSSLQSERWVDRADAYDELRSDPAAISSANVREKLLQLLDRENHVIESNLRESQNQAGAEDKFGEEYAEYVAGLGETVDSFADWNDTRQVCIYVHEPYNPESRFATKIASHGKVALPCLIRMYDSDLPLLRAEASPVIVQALAKSKEALDARTIRDAKQLVIKALRDPDNAVRINTVQALGAYGRQDMIPALERVAETDPSPEVNGYSIRKWATEAIAAINARARE